MPFLQRLTAWLRRWGCSCVREAGIRFMFAQKSRSDLLSLPKGRVPAAALMREINFVSRYFSLGEQRGEGGGT